jgi:Uma2 family endonuclease
VLAPDLAGWHAGRAQGLADAIAVRVVPDWICEILSPGTHRYDRLVKMDRFARLGVAWAWLVDLAEAVQEVYRLHEGAWLRVQSASSDEELAVLTSEVTVRLAGWFSR